MRPKVEPASRRVIHLPPAVPENVEHKSKPGETTNATADLLTAQRVVRSVSETTFVHFYLACGHLITVSRNELEGAPPSKMDCWACAADK
jgi:hypothetical protein